MIKEIGRKQEQRQVVWAHEKERKDIVLATMIGKEGKEGNGKETLIMRKIRGERNKG